MHQLARPVLLALTQVRQGRLLVHRVLLESIVWIILQPVKIAKPAIFQEREVLYALPADSAHLAIQLVRPHVLHVRQVLIPILERRRVV